VAVGEDQEGNPGDPLEGHYMEEEVPDKDDVEMGFVEQVPISER